MSLRSFITPLEFTRLTKENFLVFDADVAEAIGLNEAIILSQLNYWLKVNQKNNKNFHNGRYWCYNTFSDWRENNFSFFSESTIRRAFGTLKELGIVVTMPNPQTKFDKTNFYSIDYEQFGKFMGDWFRQKMKENLKNQNEHIDVFKLNRRHVQNEHFYNISESTTENTSNSFSQNEFCETRPENLNTLPISDTSEFQIQNQKEEDSLSDSVSEQHSNVLFQKENETTVTTLPISYERSMEHEEKSAERKSARKARKGVLSDEIFRDASLPHPTKENASPLNSASEAADKKVDLKSQKRVGVKKAVETPEEAEFRKGYFAFAKQATDWLMKAGFLKEKPEDYWNKVRKLHRDDGRITVETLQKCFNYYVSSKNGTYWRGNTKSLKQFFACFGDIFSSMSGIKVAVGSAFLPSDKNDGDYRY